MGTRYRDTKIGKRKEENQRKRGEKALKKAIIKAKEEGTFKHPMKDDKNRWDVKDMVKAVHSATGVHSSAEYAKRDARKRSKKDYSLGTKAASYKWKEPAKENK